MNRPLSTLRRLQLKTREVLGRPPLAEEQLGALPDPADPRDYVKTGVGDSGLTFSLRTYGQREALDQGRTNSCTGHAGSTFLFNLFGRLIGTEHMWRASPFWLYYQARALSGMQNADQGAYLRDLMKVMYEGGIATDDMHPSRDPRAKPDALSLRSSKTLRLNSYARIIPGPTAVRVMLHTLQAERLPIIIGVVLPSSVNDHDTRITGIIKPHRPDERALGGHAMMIDGYDARSEMFEGWNSWGPLWGQGGRFRLPFSYVSNAALVTDIWTVDYSFW